MKTQNKFLAVAAGICLMAGGLTSCDYLDIVPEQTVPEEAVASHDLEEI